MPHKNSPCPKCGGRVKQIKFLERTRYGESWIGNTYYVNRDIEYGWALFKCQYCGYVFKSIHGRRIHRQKRIEK